MLLVQALQFHHADCGVLAFLPTFGPAALGRSGLAPVAEPAGRSEPCTAATRRLSVCRSGQAVVRICPEGLSAAAALAVWVACGRVGLSGPRWLPGAVVDWRGCGLGRLRIGRADGPGEVPASRAPSLGALRALSLQAQAASKRGWPWRMRKSEAGLALAISGA